MTDSYVEGLLSRYFSKGIVVDTNILLLLFVGMLGKQKIERFKRTDQFTSRDYELLTELLPRFRKVATTPNILTEVSSLINQLREPDRAECYKFFSESMNSLDGIATLEEVYLPSAVVSRSSAGAFTRHGLTDCVIAELAKSSYLILTDDLRVSTYYREQGIDTINFNNLRYVQ